MYWLLGTRMVLPRFLVLYRFNRKLQLPEATFENEIMPYLIGPGLLNRSHLCWINAFVQRVFHILALRLIILAWPNDDPIGTELRLLFARISRCEVTSAASLSLICEPGLVPGKDCSEFGMQIFQALHNSSSEGVRDTVENLSCCQLSTRFHGPFSQENVIHTQEFF
jgi:hypothetical protein